MTINYTSPKAFRNAVTDRAKRQAANNPSTSVPRLQRQFAYGCFLSRLFTPDDNEWVLKGGIALLARLPDARHSQDIDLARKSSSPDETVATLETLLRPDFGDFFDFRLGKSKPMTGLYSGVGISVSAYLGETPFTNFSIDVVFGVNMTTAPDLVRPYHAIAIPGMEDRTPWRVYPVVDHIADKFAAIAQTYGSAGLASSRYRDLVDLMLIAKSQQINGNLLTTAIKSEFMFRKLPLPQTFTIPNTNEWREGYLAITENFPGLVDEDFDAARELAAELFSVIERNPNSSWNSESRQWSSSIHFSQQGSIAN